MIVQILQGLLLASLVAISVLLCQIVRRLAEWRATWDNLPNIATDYHSREMMHTIVHFIALHPDQPKPEDRSVVQNKMRSFLPVNPSWVAWKGLRRNQDHFRCFRDSESGPPVADEPLNIEPSRGFSVLTLASRTPCQNFCEDQNDKDA